MPLLVYLLTYFWYFYSCLYFGIQKNRTNKDIIFFIDASNEFEKGKNQNSLTDDYLTKL